MRTQRNGSSHRLPPRLARAVPLALLVLAVAGCAGTSTPEPERRQVAFRVKKSELLVTGPLSQDKGPDEIVEVVLPAVVHDPPLRASEVDRDSAQWTTPTDAAISEFYAMKNYDVQWILSNYAVEERDPVVRILSDTQAEEQNKAFFSQIDAFFVWIEASYGPRYAFVIYALGKPSKRLLGVYRKTADGWKATGLLENDETAGIVEAALRAGQIKPL